MAEKINQQMSMTDIVMLVVLSVLWGGSFFFVEILIEYLPPLNNCHITGRAGSAYTLGSYNRAEDSDTKDEATLGCFNCCWIFE